VGWAGGTAIFDAGVGAILTSTDKAPTKRKKLVHFIDEMFNADYDTVDESMFYDNATIRDILKEDFGYEFDDEN